MTVDPLRRDCYRVQCPRCQAPPGERCVMIADATTSGWRTPPKLRRAGDIRDMPHLERLAEWSRA